MKYVTSLKCTICDKEYKPSNDLMTCPSCGEDGILDVIYDYEKMKLEVDKEYFENNQNYSMLRYTPLMSINKTHKQTLHVGWTPLYQSINLAKAMGMTNLYIKDDSLNPTASLKDRASLVACLKAIETGKHTICCSSTGNAASSLAGNAAKLGLKSVIFVPERIPPGKLSQLVIYGSNVYKVQGDYKDTFTVSKEIINKFDFYNRNAAINPHLVEGKKTVALEIAEQLHFEDIDYVITSVGDGCTIGGVYKGFYDLKKLDLIRKIPKIVGVQSSGCSPFYNAWLHNDEIKETDENTIADSIAVGIPRNPIKGLNAVRKSEGFFISVTDEEILDAISILGKTEGIFSEPAAGASFAGMIKAVKIGKIKQSAKTVVINTGNGLKDIKSIINRVNEVNSINKDKILKNIQKNTMKVDFDDFIQNNQN